MKKYIVQLVLPVFMSGAVLCAGCNSEEKPAGGTAEQMGREIDKAVQEAGKQMQEMKEEAGKKMEEAGKAMQGEHGGH